MPTVCGKVNLLRITIPSKGAYCTIMLPREKGLCQLPYAKIAEMAEKAGAERLTDYSATGRERPWAQKKDATNQLADLYDYVNPAKARRLRLCGAALIFCRAEGGGLKLKHGQFCKVGLCPLCQWRRARKVYYQMSRIFEELADREADLSYIFLTLTVRTVAADEIAPTLDAMASGWQRLTQTRAYRQAVQGAYRGLEITHDTHKYITTAMYRRAARHYDAAGLRIGDANPNYDRYHPHYHCILAVPRKYFTGRGYMPAVLWGELWRRSMRLDYDPIVDVRRIQGSTADAVAETCKYTVKESDFMTGNVSYDVRTVAALDAALHHRRLMSLTGIFKDVHKALNLTEIDDTNALDREDGEEAGDGQEISFVWCTGVRDYLATPYL